MAQTQAKIANLLNDYAAGKLNREQFDAIYAHFEEQVETEKLAYPFRVFVQRKLQGS